MEQKEDLSAEKLRGGYYTPSDIADFIVRWGMEINPTQILEPSCGDGEFIKALVRYASKNPQKIENCNVLGTELLQSEAEKSNQVMIDFVSSTRCRGQIDNLEFFEYAEKNFHSKNSNVLPDFIMGNPPYIRYQSFIHGRERAEKRLHELGVNTTKHANSWLHFLAESVSLMNKDKLSRIGFVIPTELMHITYAKHLRRWLENKLTGIRIITFRDLIFEGVQQEVILFLGERDPKKIGSRSSIQSNLRVLQFENIQSVPDGVWDYYNKKAPKAHQFQDKWTGYFLTSEELDLYHKYKKNFNKFSDYMSIDIGIVTGANKFFCVNQDELATLSANIGTEDHGVSIKPLMGRSNEVSGMLFSEKDFMKNFTAGKPCAFLRFERGVGFDELDGKWKKKILHGQSLGLHKRYKCRIREPWYWIPYVHSSPMSMFKRAGDYTRLIVNECNAFTTDTVYRIYPIEREEKITPYQLAFCFINSLTFLSCELEGRFYGGGVLEMVPSEVEETIFPFSNKITKTQFNKLNKMVRENQDINNILDYSDEIILNNISKRHRQKLREMWEKLKQRRLVRAKSKKKM